MLMLIHRYYDCILRFLTSREFLSRDVAAVASAGAPGLELLEEGLLHGLLQGDPLTRLVAQHHPDEVEHLLPVLVAAAGSGDVAGQRLALAPHVAPARALLVPLELALGEVFELGPLRHLGGDRAEDALHHGEVLLAAVCVEHHEAHGQLEDDAAHRPHVALLVPTWRKLINIASQIIISQTKLIVPCLNISFYLAP